MLEVVEKEDEEVEEDNDALALTWIDNNHLSLSLSFNC